MPRLEELCQKASSGIAQKDLDGRDGSYPIYGASGFIKNVDFYHQEKPYVAVVKDGAGVGRVMKLPAKSSVIGTMQYIIPNADVHVSYLAYALESMNLAKYYTGATIPHIYFKDYCKELLPDYGCDEQCHIATVLDKVSGLISLQKQQLAKLDELVKARFVEMFGDPLFNERRFPCKEGKALFCFSSGKFLDEKRRMTEGVPVYGGNGIAWYTDSPLVRTPTIVIGRVGAYCGNVRLVTEPAWITDNAIYIKQFKTEAFELRFLYALMRYLDFSRFADYSGQPKITQKPLENVDYIVPPIELQEQFATFVKQTNKSKLTIQQGLDKLELLKKALMQQYFKKKENEKYDEFSM